MYVYSRSNNKGVNIRLSLTDQSEEDTESRTGQHFDRSGYSVTQIPITSSYLTKQLNSIDESSVSFIPENRRPGNFYTSQFVFQAIQDQRVLDIKVCAPYINLKKCFDKEGRNPLFASIFMPDENKRRKILRFFIKSNLPDRHVDKTYGRDVIAWTCARGMPWELEFLLDNRDGDYDFHLKDRDGNTYLHLAVQSQNFETVDIIVNLMVSCDVSLDVPNNLGLTPYILARRLGLRVISQLLLCDGGASPQRADDVFFKSPREWSVLGFHERHDSFFNSVNTNKNKNYHDRSITSHKNGLTRLSSQVGERLKTSHCSPNRLNNTVHALFERLSLQD